MTEYHVPLSNPIKLKVHSFPLEKRTIILNYEPTVFPQGWSSRLMFFDQSHFKFTLNQTGDTSHVLDRGFWEPIAVKSHHVSFLTLWKLPTEVHSKGTLVSALNRDTRRFSRSLIQQCTTIDRAVNMRRSQQKRKSTGSGTTGQPPVRRRSTAGNVTSTAGNVTSTNSTARTSSTRAGAVHPGAREEPQSAAGLERWAVVQPANWSTAKLRRLIEASRGLKLPSGMKKPQLIRMYLDNCDTVTDDAEFQETPTAAKGHVRHESETTAAYNSVSEPRPPHDRVTPATRWGLAADLNGMATRARQRHQPRVSTPAETARRVFTAADVSYVPTPEDVPDTRFRTTRARQADDDRRQHDATAVATITAAEFSEVEPLVDAVRNLQHSMLTLTRQM